MTKNIKSRKGFALVPALLIVVAILVIGRGAYYLSTKNSTPSETPSQPEPNGSLPIPENQNTNPQLEPQNETSNWKTYADTKLGFEFKYPSDWIVKVLEEELKIEPKNKQSADDFISVGGEPDCKSKSSKCLTIALIIPFATKSQNKDTLKVFDLLTRSVSVKPNGIELISPTPDEIWESSKTHTIKWKSKFSTPNVAIQLLDTRKSDLDSIVWITNDIPDTGNYQIVVPQGNLLTSKIQEYGPFQINIVKIDVQRNATYAAWSKLFFIKSSTGEPSFPPVPTL